GLEHRLTADLHRALVGLVRTDQHPQQGRLSRSVAAGERDSLAGMDLQVQPVQHREVTETLGESTDPDDGFAFCHRPRLRSAGTADGRGRMPRASAGVARRPAPVASTCRTGSPGGRVRPPGQGPRAAPVGSVVSGSPVKVTSVPTDHATQPRRATLRKRSSDIAAMFDEVAAGYDLTNPVMTAGLDRSWRRAVVEAVDPQPGQLVLDLAAGTGVSSVELAATGATVVPCDISVGMLQVGR